MFKNKYLIAAPLLLLSFAACGSSLESFPRLREAMRTLEAGGSPSADGGSLQALQMNKITFKSEEVPLTFEAVEVLSGTTVSAILPMPDDTETLSFAGWFDDKGRNAASSSCVIRRDTVLTALWKPKSESVTVMYTNSRGDAPESFNVAKGTILDKDRLPSLAGDGSFLFSGWYDEIAGTAAVPGTYEVKEPVTLTAKWYDTDSGTLAFKEKEDGTVSISSGEGLVSGSEIVIPSSYNGKPVTEISAEAFKPPKDGDNRVMEDYYKNIKTLVIPDSVTKIGHEAFAYLSGITSCAIPDGVTEIGYRAFADCESLKIVNIPGSVTKIADTTFDNCSSLQNVVIPESVTEIGWGAFWGCKSFTEVTVPDSVTKIDDQAFAFCSGVKTVNIPSNVTSIGKGTFESCTSLKHIEIPDDVKSIGGYAFKECLSLREIVIPDSVVSLEEGAFQACTELKSLVIGNSVTEIPRYAFMGCIRLTDIRFGNAVEVIGESAFEGCGTGRSADEKLRSIVLPASIKRIEKRAFAHCTELAKPAIPDSVYVGREAFLNESGGGGGGC